MADPSAIAEAFFAHYARVYATADRASLASLYGPDSIVSLNGQTLQGAAAVAAALSPRMAAGPVHIHWATKDAQVMPPGNMLLVLAVGQAADFGGNFTDLCVLAPTAAGSWYIKNEIIRFGPPGGIPQNKDMDSGLAMQFCSQYYPMYSSSKAALVGLYQDHSQLTFEKHRGAGRAAIAGVLAAMPDAAISPLTVDVHPVSPDRSTLAVLVTGALVLTGEKNPLPFSQAFHLLAAPAPHVANEIMRFAIL